MHVLHRTHIYNATITKKSLPPPLRVTPVRTCRAPCCHSHAPATPLCSFSSSFSMGPAKKKKTARMTTYGAYHLRLIVNLTLVTAPPPYPGASKRNPIDVDAEDDMRTNLRCTVILREAKIRKLLRRVQELEDELERDCSARKREMEELSVHLQELKDMVSGSHLSLTRLTVQNSALIIERDNLRKRLRRDMYRVASNMCC